MKNIALTTCLSALLLLMMAALASAYNKVRLTFQRTGTSASDVIVTVSDENGSAISGASATLESVTSGKGATSEPATVALFDTEDMASNTAFLGVNMGSNNTLDGYVQFTFKISGLSGFAYNHVDANVASINYQGTFQTNKSSHDALYYKLEAWNTNVTKPMETLISNSKFDINPEPHGTVANALWVEGKGSTAFTAAAEEYLVVRFTKITSTGCFMSLKELDLYNGYLVKTTSVTNTGLSRVATFSGSANVEFDGATTAYIVTSLADGSACLSPLSEGKSLAAKQGAVVSTSGTSYWEHNGGTAAGSATGTVQNSTKYTVAFAYASSAEADSRDNLLVGGGDETLALTAGEYYIFNKATSGEAQFSVLGSDGNTTLAANKAALKKQGGSATALRLDFGTSTAVQTATVDAGGVQLPTYDLSGRIVSGKLPAGVYVKGGRKFVVK